MRNTLSRIERRLQSTAGRVRANSQGCRFAAASLMSFQRHKEIFPSDGGAGFAANAPTHRLDEFPAGYSSAGCSPAEPASASPAGHQYVLMSSCRSRDFHRTANCVLTVCVSQGGKGITSRTAAVELAQAVADCLPARQGALPLPAQSTPRVRHVRARFSHRCQ